MSNQELTNFLCTKKSENFDKIEIPLNLIEIYLKKILALDFATNYSSIISLALAKIAYLMERDYEIFTFSKLNEIEFRHWLCKKEKFWKSAKMAFKYEEFKEYFEIAKKIAIGELKDFEFNVEEFFEILLRYFFKRNSFNY